MAKIPQYTAPLGGVADSAGRRASPSDFGADVHAATGEFARGAAGLAEQFLRQKETDDARAMMLGIAQANAKYSTAQQESIQNGADLEPMREKFADEMAQLRNQSTTKHGTATFDYHEATTMQTFDMRTLQITAQRAGAQARTQIEGFATALGQQVFNDPSALPYLREKIKDFAGNLPPGVSPEMRAEAEQELWYRLNSDAARGSTLINPTQTLSDLKAGKYVLKPGQLPQEIDRAESSIRANEERAHSAQRFAAWERSEKSNNLANQYLQEVFNGNFDPVAANANGDLTKEDRQSLITFNRRWWDAVEGEGRKSSPLVLNSFLQRVYAEEGDPKKIRTIAPLLEAANGGGLSVRDARWLITAVAEQRDPNNSTIGAQFRSMFDIVKDSFMNDPRYARVPGGRIQAGEIVNRWAFAVRSKMDDRRTRNQSLLPLFDPSSDDYVGKPDFVKGFVRTTPNIIGPEPGSIHEKDGVSARFLGGDPGAPTSWEVLKGEVPVDWVNEWRQATGGTIRPGETEAQAVRAWRAQREVGGQ